MNDTPAVRRLMGILSEKMERYRRQRITPANLAAIKTDVKDAYKDFFENGATAYEIHAGGLLHPMWLEVEVDAMPSRQVTVHFSDKRDDPNHPDHMSIKRLIVDT